jgi:hypothetical protein
MLGPFTVEGPCGSREGVGWEAAQAADDESAVFGKN